MLGKIRGTPADETTTSVLALPDLPTVDGLWPRAMRSPRKAPPRLGPTMVAPFCHLQIAEAGLGTLTQISKPRFFSGFLRLLRDHISSINPEKNGTVLALVFFRNMKGSV